MDAPKCRLCGKREWNHVCKTVPVVPVEAFTKAAEAAGWVEPAKPKRAKFDRNAYQRELMRKRRAKPAAV